MTEYSHKRTDSNGEEWTFLGTDMSSDEVDRFLSNAEEYVSKRYSQDSVKSVVDIEVTGHRHDARLSEGDIQVTIWVRPNGSDFWHDSGFRNVLIDDMSIPVDLREF